MRQVSICISLVFILVNIAMGQAIATKEKSQGMQAEIIYHMCQRSFYDSNGDLHGDLPGIEQKLDYLQHLGVTSILLLPLYESIYYHNYFADDFEKIDPEFGTEEHFISLVEAVHERGMKIYMDMETQYITEDHAWYQDAFQNPESPYSDFLIFNGPNNSEPESIIFNLTELEGFDGSVRKITTINLLNPKVKEYLIDLYSYWVDPNNDGDFSDGVDGFRIDHMMDDLDWKGKLTGLFKYLWKPLFDELRTINPNIRIVGEQADWFHFSPDYFSDADLDWLFAFGIKFGIGTLQKTEIQNKVDSTFQFTPDDKNQLIFLENHDTRRFANEVASDPALLRIGAALNLLLPGIPTIYYGQEIGMKGEGGFQAFGMTDGNDIPRREAFEWTSTIDQPGMALWYKDSGPWWDERNIVDRDGISVEEQTNEPGSLLNFYKTLITLRKENPALFLGDINFLDNGTDHVLSFLRSYGDQKILIQINLKNEKSNFPLKSDFILSNSEFISLTSSDDFVVRIGDDFTIDAYQIQIAEVQNK